MCFFNGLHDDGDLVSYVTLTARMSEEYKFFLLKYTGHTKKKLRSGSTARHKTLRSQRLSAQTT